MVTSRWILDSSVPLIYKSSSHITKESLGHPMSLIVISLRLIELIQIISTVRVVNESNQIKFYNI